MICNRVASTRATIYSLSGSLPTAIFSKYYFIYLIYFGQINISVCLSVCLLAGWVEGVGRFCHEVYTDAGTDWLTFRHQIVLNLGLFILQHQF